MVEINQLNLAVRSMEATLAFYRALGVAIEPTPDGRHAAGTLPNGVTLELDTLDFVPEWDTGWSGAPGGGAVIGFAVATRDEVDRLHAELLAHGGRAHQPPYDAFWGARYAIVDDPDGRPVGVMSPVDEERRFWPPGRPPTAG